MCGWLLPPLSQWKSGHMPFPHQKMRWQVADYFFFLLETGTQVLTRSTWKCANPRSILLWWNLLSVWILHFCRLGEEAILAHSTMLTQCYFKINLCLLLIILHLLKVKWGGFQVTFPQKGGSEPWTVCKDGSFPRCPFGSRTICPFRNRKCADRLANFWNFLWTGFEKLIKSSLCFHAQVWAEKAVHRGNAALPLVHEEPEQPVELLRGKVQQGTKQATEQG